MPSKKPLISSQSKKPTGDTSHVPYANPNSYTPALQKTNPSAYAPTKNA